MLEEAEMVGRKPAKNFSELYPGWPAIPSTSIADEVDARFLLFVHRFQEVFEKCKRDGKVTTIKDFAENLDMSAGLIHGLLNGEKFPSLQTVLKLEGQLGCTLLDSYETYLHPSKSDIRNAIH